MRNLTVRHVPDDVYASLVFEAQRSGRSLAAVAREALRAHAGSIRRQRLDQTLDAVDILRASVLARRDGRPTANGTGLVREDRDR